MRKDSAVFWSQINSDGLGNPDNIIDCTNCIDFMETALEKRLSFGSAGSRVVFSSNIPLRPDRYFGCARSKSCPAYSFHPGNADPRRLPAI